MKKQHCLLVIGIMLMLLAGCGKIIGNNELGNAEGSDCEVWLTVKKGEDIERYTLTDNSEKENVIAYCNGMGNAVAEPEALTFSEEAIEYEIEVSYKDGVKKTVSWKEGYLFTDQGKVYETDSDFALLLSIYQWQYINENIE